MTTPAGQEPVSNDAPVIDADPKQHFAEMLRDCEALRKRVEQLVLWEQKYPYGETGKKTRPSEVLKGDPPLVAQLIKRAESARRCTEFAEKAEAEGELKSAAAFELAAERHSTAIERLLSEFRKADMMRLKTIQTAITEVGRLEQKERHHSQYLRRTVDLSKLPMSLPGAEG